MANNKKQFTPRPSAIDRPDREEIEQMVFHKIVVENQTNINIISWLRDPDGYNYGKTQAYDIVRTTREYITEVYRETGSHTLDAVLTELEDQLSGARDRKEWRLALDIQREINKITGKYKENIDISGEVTFVTKWGE